MSTVQEGEQEPIEPHLLAMKDELQTELSRLKSQGLATTATDQALDIAASQLCTRVQHLLDLDALHD
jgi:myosin heavy subunit